MTYPDSPCDDFLVEGRTQFSLTKIQSESDSISKFAMSFFPMGSYFRVPVFHFPWVCFMLLSFWFVIFSEDVYSPEN